MPDLFIIDLSYKAALERIDKHMKEHMQFLEICYKNKVFLASGRKKPRNGGIIIARGLSREQLLTLMQQDPFIKLDLADVHIIEFSASQFQPELKPLLNP